MQCPYSEISNTRADHNKQVWRESFFIYYMKTLEYGQKLSHLLHEKLKVWWKKFPKKLSEHAR